MFVTHPAYIREKARALRIEKDLTIDEIADRLGISRQTIFYWVRDLPLKKEPRWNPGPAAAAKRNQYAARRDDAYAKGWIEFDDLAKEPTFRDFVCMYIGEGYKRCRNTVALANSDPDVVMLASRWIRRLSRNKLRYEVQHHADQDPEDLRGFWTELLGIDPGEMHFVLKSNSGQLRGRTWRCKWGVVSVRSCDTLLRARLQAWIDRVHLEWVDSAMFGA